MTHFSGTFLNYPVHSGIRRKFSWRGFIQWFVVVICIWCAVFATSQFDVMVMFPNQRFREICWHNMHVLLHALPLIYVSLHWFQTISVQVRISEENTINATTQQFIIAKISGCALKQGSKTSPLRQNNLQLQNEAALISRWIRAVKHRKCAAGLFNAHPDLQRSNLAKLHKNWECA